MRLLAALAALTLTLAASPALAQGRAAPMRGALLVGFEDGDGPAGLALRFDGELVQKPLSPGLGFSIVGSLGFTRFSDDGGYRDFSGFDNSWEAAVNVFKLVPAARFTFGRSPSFRPYVDAGVGLYYASWSYEERGTTYVGYPYYTDVPYTAEYDDSEVSLMLRLAAGLAFDVSPGLALGAELGVTPYLGDLADDSTMSLMFAAQFRL